MVLPPQTRAICAPFMRGVEAYAAGGGILTVVLSALLVGSLCCANAGAQVRVTPTATYFVSCRGNDENNGTSSATPWATLSKASGERYGAGDQVLFLRNCIW